MSNPSSPASALEQRKTPPVQEVEDDPDQDDTTADDLPMTMAASVVLDQLPQDAQQALETAGELELAKGKSFIQISLKFTPFSLDVWFSPAAVIRKLCLIMVSIHQSLQSPFASPLCPTPRNSDSHGSSVRHSSDSSTSCGF